MFFIQNETFSINVLYLKYNYSHISYKWSKNLKSVGYCFYEKIENGFLKMSNTKQETSLILGDIKFEKGYEIYVLRICAILYPLLFSLMNQLIGKVGILEDSE